MYLQRSPAQTKLSVLQLAFLMKRGFLFSQPRSASSAEQPASDGSAAQPGFDGSAVQPVFDGSAAQPPITCRSIADVDSWLKANTAALGLSLPLIDWISNGITNWIYSDPDPFVSHAEISGPEFLKIFRTHVPTS